MVVVVVIVGISVQYDFAYHLTKLYTQDWHNVVTVNPCNSLSMLMSLSLLMSLLSWYDPLLWLSSAFQYNTTLLTI